MARIRDYLSLFRVKHYIKNILVFIPLFFAKGFGNADRLRTAVFGALAFCLISSAVYIVNDLRDADKDRSHPVKKNRPIAAGKISRRAATLAAALCLPAFACLSFLTGKPLGVLFPLVYFALNIAYSCGLKNKPIADVVILASGYVIRILYGGYITGTVISQWLFLVVTAGSLFMGLGKRRNELRLQSETRDVLKRYTDSFLDRNMYVCAALVNVFYALWASEFPTRLMCWTVPFFLVIFMRYSFNIEGNSDGDPIEVVLHDRVLLLLAICFTAAVAVLIYAV